MNAHELELEESFVETADIGETMRQALEYAEHELFDQWVRLPNGRRCRVSAALKRFNLTKKSRTQNENAYRVNSHEISGELS